MYKKCENNMKKAEKTENMILQGRQSEKICPAGRADLVSEKFDLLHPSVGQGIRCRKPSFLLPQESSDSMGSIQSEELFDSQGVRAQIADHGKRAQVQSKREKGKEQDEEKTGQRFNAPSRQEYDREKRAKLVSDLLSGQSSSACPQELVDLLHRNSYRSGQQMALLRDTSNMLKGQVKKVQTRESTVVLHVRAAVGTIIDLSAEMRRVCEMIEEEMHYHHNRRTDITTVQEEDLKSSLGTQYLLLPPPSPLSYDGALALPPPPVEDQILLSTISGLEGTHANVRKVEARVATPEDKCVTGRRGKVVTDITDEQGSSNSEGSRDTTERERTTELETLVLQLRAKCSAAAGSVCRARLSC